MHNLLSDSEIFGWSRPQPRRRPFITSESPEMVYGDLKPGDWVVHVDHGIGQFIGLHKPTLDGVQREYLTIQYKDNDLLYVPIHQADRISRYIGTDGSTPSPSRLGGAEWGLTKSRARHAVVEVAEDLLELYAKRRQATGFSFSPDTDWQKELEASFAYIETLDQNLALEQVKADMESDRPMDRLLCGDVGFGKTEVALRAAFKAVNDGKQVAILVPTTVLAQQHFDTFSQRLSVFPVPWRCSAASAAPKSRMKSSKSWPRSRSISSSAHRLISNDVQFSDLGLVIIDEEQRFGVAHKEHLKKLRSEVDVLTLTATPSRGRCIWRSPVCGISPPSTPRLRNACRSSRTWGLTTPNWYARRSFGNWTAAARFFTFTTACNPSPLCTTTFPSWCLKPGSGSRMGRSMKANWPR